MGEIISGKELSSNVLLKLKEDVIKYNEMYKRLPLLVVILVGDDPASKSYVSGKEKTSKSVGILNKTIRLSEDTTEEYLLNLIDELNADPLVDGILVQLPLPKHINQNNVIGRIALEKDVDGFHPLNVAALYEKRECVVPCTPKGIVELLQSKNIDVSGKNVCVIGRSNIVGLPIFKLLTDLNATVTLCHSKTKDLKSHTLNADILVVAIGRARFITADMVRDGAVVIDVGVNRDESTKKLCGDVDFDNIKDKASYITPVPGGVGPMTICCLMENTVACYLKRVSK